ncbi:MAG: A/G-specific adenine glycosylase [Gammaproteobacteria bacterium]|nr:A/G-specific adenine glycosylase [Gammaproteobacteria bacterium]
MSPALVEGFSERLLHWYARHGRSELPWKLDPTPYRVWVSEIMLQQTQVATVIPYFETFMHRFPSLDSLAAADLDEVLHLWTGLGYYARARNLHKAARAIMEDHNGRFPTDFESVLALPGIGRSTAGAILAQSLDQRHAILDGNVKRVLVRLHGIEGWPGERQVESQLWDLTEAYTPTQEVADYTQAIMDLGATLCRRGRPDCDRCPFETDCTARQLGLEAELPHSRPKKEKPIKATCMLILLNESGEVLLQQRPPSGIWGGLWSLPECELDTTVTDWVSERLDLKVLKQTPLPSLRHSFSHYHLDIRPIIAHTRPLGRRLMEDEASVWYNTRQPDRRGLAAPVVKLLKQVEAGVSP